MVTLPPLPGSEMRISRRTGVLSVLDVLPLVIPPPVELPPVELPPVELLPVELLPVELLPVELLLGELPLVELPPSCLGLVEIVAVGPAGEAA